VFRFFSDSEEMSALPPRQSAILAAAGVRPPPLIPSGTSDLITLSTAIAYTREVKKRKMDRIPTSTAEDISAAKVRLHKKIRAYASSK
jgi:hypothetical protein